MRPTYINEFISLMNEYKTYYKSKSILNHKQMF